MVPRTGKALSMSHDYVSYWYRARVESGESDDIKLGLINTQEPHQDNLLHIIPHQAHDGFGAVSRYLHARQIAFYAPQYKPRPRPSLLTRLRYLLSTAAKREPIPWRYHNTDTTESSSPVARHIFTQAETAQLEAFCTQTNTSLSLLLMHCINQVVFSELLDVRKSSNKQFSWLFPVDMRSAVQLYDPLINHTSAVYLSLAANDKPHDIAAKLYQAFKNGEHWKTWALANIGKLIGSAGVRWLYKNGKKHARNNTLGSCTYLGAWGAKAGQAASHSDWAFVAIGLGSKQYPVTPGAIKWNDRLSLTLKLNGSILPADNLLREALCDQCLDQWKKNLLHTSEPSH